MNKILKLVFCFLLSIAFCKSYSQTVIDYSSWSTGQCNAFYPSSNVNGIAHTTTCGTVVYDNVNHAVQLDAKAENNIYSGTEYKLSYNFKQGYSYSIKINAWSNTPTYPVPNSKMRVDFNSASNGSGYFCNGVESFNTTSSLTNDNNKEITPGAYHDYTFSYNSLSAAQSFLYIGGFLNYVNGTATSWILIKKVTITETASSPSFTLPSTTNVQCSSPTTFTVTTASNPGNLTITNYAWNLGTTPNGWLYNGSPAPQTVSTGTSNTISLTRNSATSTVISATVTAGGNNYNTNNSNVTTATPSLSITGPFNFCTEGTYTVTNLPSGSSVSWSASPSGVVYFTNASGAQVTVNKSNAGIINLTATVTTPCGTYTVYSSSITVGVPLNGSVFTSPDQGLTLKSWAEGYNYVWEDSWVYWGLQGTSASQYSIVGGYTSWTPSNYFPNVTFYMDPGTYVTFAVAVTNGGCSETLHYTFVPISNPYSYSYYSLAPNPVSSDLTIYLDDEKLKKQKIEKSPDQVIQQVIILDKLGNALLQQKYPADTRKVTMNVSGLSPDMYVAKIFNGKKWVAIKFLKK